MKSQSGYSNDSYGKRNPFVPFLRWERESKVHPVLQRYDLNEYELIGVRWFRWARTRKLMDRFATRPVMTHIIEIGHYIGKNWGQVSSINRDSIGVKETFQMHDGDELIIEKFLKVGGGMGR